MPEIDLTISISVILAVCAIISPIATTLINNRYQLKLKDLEYQQKEKEDSVRSAQTFRKYKIKGIKFPTSSPIQAKGDKNRISCILKIEYTASGIHESCGRNKPRQPQKPYATTSKERARNMQLPNPE